jgi:CRP-like cAMP-binding protein
MHSLKEAAMTVATDVLKTFPLFDDLESHELQMLSSVASWEICPAGKKLFREGDSNGTLYGVVTGSLNINKRARFDIEQTLSRIYPGDFVGEVGFVNGGSHCASAEAVEDASVFKIAREDFDSLAFTCPQLGLKVALKIARQMGRFLKDMDDQYLNLSNYVWGRGKC